MSSPLIAGSISIAAAEEPAESPRWTLRLKLGPHAAQGVAAAEIDFAAWVKASGRPGEFNPYSLRVAALDGGQRGKSLAYRFDPRYDPARGTYHTAGRLLFVVPGADTSQVEISLGAKGPAADQAPTVPLIGDGDMLRLAGGDQEPMLSSFLGKGCRPALVDFDGDGRRDMVGAGRYGEGQPLVWFRNVGSDTKPLFSERETFPLATTDGAAIVNPSARWLVCAAFCDWDGDGARDLIRGSDPEVYWHKNVGTNERPRLAPGKLIFSAPMLVHQIDAADWDGDGDIDLLSGSYPSSRLYLIENQGPAADGSAKPAAPVPLVAGGMEIDFLSLGKPSVGDWDGDGDLDLLAGQYYVLPGSPGPGNPRGDVYGIYYFENVGDRSHPKLAAGVQLRARDGRVIVNGHHTQPTMADWNLDGVMDVIVSGGKGTDVYVNRGTVTDVRLERQAIPWRGYEPLRGSDFAAPVVVDFDSDGTLDLIVADAEGFVYFFRGVAGMQFAAPMAIKSEGRPIDECGESDEGDRDRGYTKVVPVDWNGDGRRDLVMWSMNCERGWLRGWGPESYSLKFFAGTSEPFDFGPPQEIRAADRQIVAGWRCKPDLVDLDADGLVDLVQCIGTGQHESDYYTIQWFKNVGTHTDWKLAAGVPLLLRRGGRPMIPEINEGRRMCVRLVDWDGDGDLDLFTGRDSQAHFQHPGVRYWENVGTKHEPLFADFKTLSLVNERIHSWHEVVVDAADLDRDGRLDLVIGNGDLGTVHFFRRSFLDDGYCRAEPVKDN